MTLWAPVELATTEGHELQGLGATTEGHELQGLGDAFVGRHVVPRYRGYMQAQAMRLLGLRGSSRGVRGSGGREELIAAHGFDSKYAMHCARLGFQCIELLTTGGLALPMRGEPADWLRAVRRGDVSFDDWWARALELDAQLVRFEEDDALPPGPERGRIERWTIDTHLRVWADRC